jgi:ATP-dependent Clp protease ATP-binding subunit ClpB
VGEPNFEECLAILRGVKARYEIHHGVRITDAALAAAVNYSTRYVTGRALPDKAIELVDEAASRLRLVIDSLPTEIDEVERRIVSLEMQRTALLRETTKDAMKAEGHRRCHCPAARSNRRAEGAVGIRKGWAG